MGRWARAPGQSEPCEAATGDYNNVLVTWRPGAAPNPGAGPLRKFVFFNIPQIQYKNPWVQIMMFKNMTPSPFLRFYLDSGEQVLVDVETKSNKEIMEHIKKILGKNEETLKKEEQEKEQLFHPANFGPRKYCLRECICEVEGQVPCPALVPLPKEMTGRYKATLKASAQD
ncbi:small ribosomal subunit protein mS25 isoform X2 [Pteropus medius]|uniref:Small ribosomal subunit protein mS25 n=1 Tax=Pteropus vampyrus TaxID=132908 RepID=A0A6P6CBR3_PTEVA|nr:28S ribosomal protein S25, mitochondrial isoform X2 [Pteropus vampyrus]XP_039693305.1 28S ribosomal protein S25, mitochondrial isoform X2 [Pteropus giganteus]